MRSRQTKSPDLERIAVYVSEAIFKKITALAVREHRSVSAQAAVLLERALEQN